MLESKERHKKKRKKEDASFSHHHPSAHSQPEREREGEGGRKKICTMPGSQNGGGSLNGMRPMKIDNIHSCARNGYLHGLKRMLQENPSLLNARDSMVFLPFV
jgi:hypothetical protein